MMPQAPLPQPSVTRSGLLYAFINLVFRYGAYRTAFGLLMCGGAHTIVMLIHARCRCMQPYQTLCLSSLCRASWTAHPARLHTWCHADEVKQLCACHAQVMRFVQELDSAGLPTTIRITRGLEAAAACGQLRNRHQKEPLPAFAVPA